MAFFIILNILQNGTNVTAPETQQNQIFFSFNNLNVYYLYNKFFYNGCLLDLEQSLKLTK